MLKNAKIIDEDEIDTEVVSIGVKVKVKDLNENEEIEYNIVGSTEADPFMYKISDESPVGAALLGKKIGDIIEVSVPDGVLKYEIISITK